MKRPHQIASADDGNTEDGENLEAKRRRILAETREIDADDDDSDEDSDDSEDDSDDDEDAELQRELERVRREREEKKKKEVSTPGRVLGGQHANKHGRRKKRGPKPRRRREKRTSH